jgi:putative AbiEi antitoxin of type IV toxin-antitoxin system
VEVERTLIHEVAEERCVHPDAAIAELADRQHGVVSREQLRALGLARGAIDFRVEAKRLHPIYRGVYAVGRRRISQRGVWMAAVLACGLDALLSHRPAAALLGIREGTPATVDVTVPRRLRPRDGIRPHRALVPEDERSVHAGIPTTGVARTLLDLAAVLQPHELRRALERAEALHLTDPLTLVAVVDRHPHRRGAGALTAALADGPLRPSLTRSELERRFLTVVDEAGLPRPLVNHWIDIGGELIQADCFWPDQRLIVELDGRTWHATRDAFDRDRRRDRRCLAAGVPVVRVTAETLNREVRELERELRTLLSSAPARSS